MRVVRDDLWLCTDCTMYAANGDLTGVGNDAREKEVVAGVDRLGPHLAADFDSNTGEGMEEFTWRACDGCRTRLGGERVRFAVLGK